jgi:hypothetical protein
MNGWFGNSSSNSTALSAPVSASSVVSGGNPLTNAAAAAAASAGPNAANHLANMQIKPTLVGRLSAQGARDMKDAMAYYQWSKTAPAMTNYLTLRTGIMVLGDGVSVAVLDPRGAYMRSYAKGTIARQQLREFMKAYLDYMQADAKTLEFYQHAKVARDNLWAHARARIDFNDRPWEWKDAEHIDPNDMDSGMDSKMDERDGSSSGSASRPPPTESDRENAHAAAQRRFEAMKAKILAARVPSSVGDSDAKHITTVATVPHAVVTRVESEAQKDALAVAQAQRQIGKEKAKEARKAHDIEGEKLARAMQRLGVSELRNAAVDHPGDLSWVNAFTAFAEFTGEHIMVPLDDKDDAERRVPYPVYVVADQTKREFFVVKTAAYTAMCKFGRTTAKKEFVGQCEIKIGSANSPAEPVVPLDVVTIEAAAGSKKLARDYDYQVREIMVKHRIRAAASAAAGAPGRALGRSERI